MGFSLVLPAAQTVYGSINDPTDFLWPAVSGRLPLRRSIRPASPPPAAFRNHAQQQGAVEFCS